MLEIPRLTYGESNLLRGGKYFDELGKTIPMLCIEIPEGLIAIDFLSPKLGLSRLGDEGSKKYVELCRNVASSVFGQEIVQLARSPATLGTSTGSFTKGSTGVAAVEVHNRRFGSNKVGSQDVGPHHDHGRLSRSGATIYGFHLMTGGYEGEVHAQCAKLRPGSDEELLPPSGQLAACGSLNTHDMHIFVRSARSGDMVMPTIHNFITAETPTPRTYVETQFGLETEW